MSLFANLYPSQLAQKSFWITEDQPKRIIKTKSIIFESSLSFSYNSDYLSDQLVKFNAKYLYFYDKEGALVYTRLKSSILYTFIEEFNNDFFYGFTIKLNPGVELDFFVESEEKLKIWVKYLSKVVILTNIEEDYVLLKTIDTGRFGSVKLCQSTNKQKEKQYALKEVKKSDLVDKKFLQQLFNEITFLRKFEHKNIIKIYRVYEDCSSVYLVLEYLPHGNLLKRILTKNKLSESEVIKFARKLFKVIEYIHSFGVIHRDLKLENILMADQGNSFKFKIIDFGLACYIDRSRKLKSGSPGYMAPEILRGRSYSNKIDIFSAGVIIYILLTGVSPLLGSTPEKTIEKNMICHIDFESKQLKHLSEPCINFLRMVLNPDPIHRPSASISMKDVWVHKEDPKKQNSEQLVKRQSFRNFNRVSSRLIVF